MKLLPHVIAATLLFGCGTNDDTKALGPGSTDMFTTDAGTGAPLPPESDFMLLDVNKNSPTFNMQVSPRDYLGKVSGWYFGRAT